MSDPTLNDPDLKIPTVAASLVHDLAQKGLTTLATGLVAGGAFAPGDAAKFESIGAGVAVYLAGCFWTWVAVKVRAAREHRLLNATPPK